MLSFDAVEVSVEDTGVAVIAEEDEGVGEGLEEGFNGSFESLVRLGVVVHYKCLLSQPISLMGLLGKKREKGSEKERDRKEENLQLH